MSPQIQYKMVRELFLKALSILCIRTTASLSRRFHHAMRQNRFFRKYRTNDLPFGFVILF